MSAVETYTLEVGTLRVAANSMDSALSAGIHRGGWGFWSGLGHIETFLYFQNLPSQSKGSSSVQAFTMKSHASSNLARDSPGLILYAKYSEGMPRTKPHITLPPLITSIIAISSATRRGWPRSGIAFPKIASFAFIVIPAMIAAIRLGEGIRPYAVKWCSLKQTASNPSSSASVIWLM